MLDWHPPPPNSHPAAHRTVADCQWYFSSEVANWVFTFTKISFPMEKPPALMHFTCISIQKVSPKSSCQSKINLDLTYNHLDLFIFSQNPWKALFSCCIGMETSSEALQAFTKQICWPLATAAASSLLQHSLVNSFQSYPAMQSKSCWSSGFFSFVFSTKTPNLSTKQGHMGFLPLEIRYNQRNFVYFFSIVSGDNNWLWLPLKCLKEWYRDAELFV